MDITIGVAVLDLDQQPVDLVAGIAQDLRDVAKLLTIGADDFGVEKLRLAQPERGRDGPCHRGARFGRALRSEEHTAELQSLIRNSYAGFCLKKKKQYNTTNTQT